MLDASLTSWHFRHEICRTQKSGHFWVEVKDWYLGSFGIVGKNCVYWIFNILKKKNHQEDPSFQERLSLLYLTLLSSLFFSLSLSLSIYIIYINTNHFINICIHGCQYIYMHITYNISILYKYTVYRHIYRYYTYTVIYRCIMSMKSKQEDSHNSPTARSCASIHMCGGALFFAAPFFHRSQLKTGTTCFLVRHVLTIPWLPLVCVCVLKQLDTWKQEIICSHVCLFHSTHIYPPKQNQTTLIWWLLARDQKCQCREALFLSLKLTTPLVEYTSHAY